jgi:hypothetical protein
VLLVSISAKARGRARERFINESSLSSFPTDVTVG